MRALIVLFGVLLAVTMLISSGKSLAGPYKTEPLLPRAERVERATRLLVGFGKLRQELPTLSPAEKEWLDREQRESLDSEGKITRRYFDLTISREWSLNEVAVPTRTVQSALERIVASNTTVDAEVLHWSVVCATLADHAFWQNIVNLIEKGTLDRDAVSFITPFKDRELLVANGALQARVIMNDVVIPILNERVE